MYRERPAETDKEHIEDLIHLYVDGALDRRELLTRIAAYTELTCCPAREAPSRSKRPRPQRRP